MVIVVTLLLLSMKDVPQSEKTNTREQSCDKAILVIKLNGIVQLSGIRA